MILVALMVCLGPARRSPMSNEPTLIPFVTMLDWRRAFWSPVCPVDSNARHVYVYLSDHYNCRTGELYLSLNTMGRDMGMCRRTVQKQLHALEEAKCLKRKRKNNRSCYQFTLLEPPWLDAAKDARAARYDRFKDASDVQMPAIEGAADAPKQESRIQITKQNRSPAAAAASRRRFDSLPNEIRHLVKRLQQMTKAPFASYDRLVPIVLDAVKRCGLADVEQLYTMLANHSDAMPAWKLYQAINALQGQSDVSTGPQEPKTEDSEPPLDRRLIDNAKELVAEAHIRNPKLMTEIMNRCQNAGHGFGCGLWRENRHAVAQALARTMAVEQGIAL
jgi:hypothetical protein